jgi:hypothetical protein
MDSVDVEQLIPPPTRSDPPLNALWGWVGDDHLGHLMMAELFQRVGQHRIIVKTIVGERETLNPFHGNEQQGKTPTPPPS